MSRTKGAPNVTQLELQHFYEAYEHAKGRYTTVTARQVWYALRAILNNKGETTMSYGKKELIRTFNMGGGYTAEVKYQSTNYGFRHLCVLFKDGREISDGKGVYYNRTWERYTGQSALYNAIDRSSLSKDEKATLNTWAAEGKEGVAEDMAPLRAVAGMAALADILCGSKECSNKLKKTAIESLPGIEMPDNWDEKTEDEKAAILDGAVNILKG